MDSCTVNQKTNRFDRVNFISKFVHNWVSKPIWQCYRGYAVQDEYYGKPPEKLSAEKLSYQWQKEWNKVPEKKRKRKLFRVMWQLFKYESFLSSFALFLRLGVLALIQAALQNVLISSFSESNSSAENVWLTRYTSSALLLAIIIILPFTTSYPVAISECIGAKVRISLLTIVYEKILRIQLAELSRINTGQLISLFASDAGKLEENARVFCARLFDPLMMIATLIYLHFTGGLPAVIGFLIIFVCGITVIILSKQFKKIAKKKAVLVDERIRLTREMISEAMSVKMLCWEEAYYKMINKIRSKELKYTFQNYCCKFLFGIMSSIAAPLAIYIILNMTLTIDNRMLAQTVYPCFSVLVILQYLVIVYFNKLTENAAIALVSLQRIEKVLNVKESDQTFDNKNKCAIVLSDVASSWDAELNEKVGNSFVLNIKYLNVPINSVTMITGPVGSGKSTLLLTMANEMYIHSGSIVTGDSLTYMPQQPWLFPATIRQNILFGLPFDEQRYQHVLEICALSQDLIAIENGDLTKVDDKGLTFSGGQKARIALARSLYCDSKVYLLDDPLSAVDVKVGKYIWEKCFKDTNKTIVLVSHNTHFLKENDLVVYIEKGHVRCGMFDEFKDKLVTSVTSDAVDNQMMEAKNQTALTEELSSPGAQNISSVVDKEITNNLKVKSSLFIYCKMAISTWNGWPMFIIMLFFAIIVQGVDTTFDYCLVNWLSSRSEGEISFITLPFLGLLLLIEFVMCTINYLVFALLCLRASKNMHNKMLKSIAKAPMSFYDVHNVGQILNRISKDLELVDDAIPMLLFECSQLTFMLLGNLFNIVYSNLLTIIPIVASMFVAMFLNRIYNVAIVTPKRNEASARSPIFTYMNCTVNGICVIKSHKKQLIVTEEFKAILDKHSSIWFLLKGMGYWSALYIEVVGNVIFLFIIILPLIWPQYTSPSRIGLAITSAFSFGSFLKTASRLIAEVNYLMTAVVRIKEYVDIPPEEIVDARNPPYFPPLWPRSGCIQFKNVELKYLTRDAKALDNVSFKINSGEKVGIVGRTGAGKSSLIAALFRLASTEGTIEIDGEDIKHLPLVEYRKKLSIIPQTPVVLSGSIRYNLDLQNQFQDEDLWGVLDNVQLKSKVSQLEKGLENDMSKFSVGEKQLFCLARTLLLKNKIIILDEATSNIDNKTDKIIQDVIKSKFQGSTMLVIAHRLQTVMDLDKIMVLQHGKIIEFDETKILLSKKSGVFKSMVEKSNIS